MLSHELSQKIRFWGFLSMVCLVFVHGYNLDERYLEPFSLVKEPLRFTTFFEYFTANGIFRFRIPMLFAISGYLLALHESRTYKEQMKSKVRTLLVPYLLWSAIGLAATFALEQFPQTQAIVRAANLREPLENYDFLTLFSGWIFSPLPFQLWFIRVLFVYNALYPFFAKLLTSNTKNVKIWFGVVGFIWLFLPIHLGLIESEGLLFFTLGIWLQKSGFDLENPPSFFRPMLWGGAWILLTAVKTVAAFYLSSIQDVSTFLFLLLSHRLSEVLGLVFAWYGLNRLAVWSMQRAWFRWVSAFSFMIYALHVPLVNYLLHPAFLLQSSFPSDFSAFRIAVYILLPSVVILFCVCIGALMRRYLPPVYHLLTGGRGLG